MKLFALPLFSDLPFCLLAAQILPILGELFISVCLSVCLSEFGHSDFGAPTENDIESSMSSPDFVCHK